jgi:hypothetical protein
MNRQCTLAALLSLLTCTAAAQPSLPTDADLRTAYCIAVLQDGIARDDRIISEPPPLPPPPAEDPLRLNDTYTRLAKLERSIAEKRRAQEADTLKRLQQFLLPRTPRLDATALQGAADKAATDIEEDKKQREEDKKQRAACSDRCRAAAREGSPATMTGSPVRDPSAAAPGARSITEARLPPCQRGCVDSERDSEVGKRLSACRNPTWLP